MSAATKFKMMTAAAVFGILTVPVIASAQNQPGGGGGNNGGGGRGNPAQWRQQMMDRVKEQLGSSDDEFAALQPKIEKVMTAQRDAMGGRMGGRGNRGGGGNQPQSATAKATEELRTTLEDKDAKPEEIKTKLDALRAAKKTAKEELTKAQEDLKGVLTARQEAVMVEMGMLD